MQVQCIFSSLSSLSNFPLNFPLLCCFNPAATEQSAEDRVEIYMREIVLYLGGVIRSELASLTGCTKPRQITPSLWTTEPSRSLPSADQAFSTVDLGCARRSRLITVVQGLRSDCQRRQSGGLRSSTPVGDMG